MRELADSVSLSRDLLERYPHQLSGGQKARVGIARGLASQPSLLILDEPTAALDVSVQAAILKLLHRLRRDLGLSYLLISHDIEVVRLMCERIIILRNGQVVEAGWTDDGTCSPAKRVRPHAPGRGAAVEVLRRQRPGSQLPVSGRFSSR